MHLGTVQRLWREALQLWRAPPRNAGDVLAPMDEATSSSKAHSCKHKRAHPASRFCEPPLQWKAVRAWVAPAWEGGDQP